jgi:hypothetical protein
MLGAAPLLIEDEQYIIIHKIIAQRKSALCDQRPT